MRRLRRNNRARHRRLLWQVKRAHKLRRPPLHNSQLTIHNSQFRPNHPVSSAEQPLAPRPSPRPTRQYRDAYPGPALNRQQLEHLASGKISEILGPVFAQQDDFVRQVRMPMPPLLLADRVLGIDAVAGAVGQKGVIWTETDIGPDAWYLHNGRVPVGVLIEAGRPICCWSPISARTLSTRASASTGCSAAR
jgi:hypothetical protein